MRFVSSILRILGLVLLAAGSVLAVGDIARSIAAERVVLMSIGEARAIVRAGEPPEPTPAQAAGVFATDGRGAALSGVLDRQPASVVLGLGGVALLLVGRRPRLPGRHFETR